MIVGTIGVSDEGEDEGSIVRISEVGEYDGPIVCSSAEGEYEGPKVSPLVGAKVGSVDKISVSVGAGVILVGGGSPSCCGSVQNITRSTACMIPLQAATSLATISGANGSGSLPRPF